MLNNRYSPKSLHIDSTEEVEILCVVGLQKPRNLSAHKSEECEHGEGVGVSAALLQYNFCRPMSPYKRCSCFYCNVSISRFHFAGGIDCSTVRKRNSKISVPWFLRVGQGRRNRSGKPR